jgi:hypothetical protein
LRPFYAPYRFLLAERLLASGFPREADQAIEEALRLEPNYSQALAWQALRGDPKLLKARVQRLHEIQNLRVSSESVDEYTRGIQGIDQNWLFQISRKLALSTGF